MKTFFIPTLFISSFLSSLAFAELPKAVEKSQEMVVTTNPLATSAGAKVLENGGNAIDAMVAVQTVLGLVEPQSSGLGGGAFAVYYDASNNKTTTFDAREKAPAAAKGNRFLNADGESIGFFTAWQSGLSVGVPGTPKMLEVMHKKFGRLSMKGLLNPAIELAENGYPLTQRTSDQVQGLLNRNTEPFSCEKRRFFRDPTAFTYFANPDCSAKEAGTHIINTGYANTLKQFLKHGSAGFYKGDVAEKIVKAVNNDPALPGDMTLDDLANYKVIEREPICFSYRKHNVCGMGPPSSGALAVGQILGILENYKLSGSPLDVRNVHLFSQAGRLAFADRNMYVGDTDFVDVPIAGMLDKGYLAARATLIDEKQDMGKAKAGTPPGFLQKVAEDKTQFEFGTSHFSIMDKFGNALSVTTTIESTFGNGVMVNGFLLNNELTDFSFKESDQKGVLIANRVQANKRPRSSMSPTIVFDEKGKVKLITGSPGGSRIIGYTAQSIMNVIDFELDPQQAVLTPHYMNRNGRTDIEKPIADVTQDYDADALANALKKLGHKEPGVVKQTSGLSLIKVERSQLQTKLIGGADYRRDGSIGGR